jgi:PAS domain S-box-containing protein
MNLHPGLEQRHEAEVKQPEVRRAELDPIFRALQENEDWYQDLVEHSQDLLCIHDLTGKLLSVNPAPARALGYSVEELLQIPMRELVAPGYRDQFDAYLEQIKREGEAHGHLCLLTRSGDRRIWKYYNTLRTEGVASPIVRGIAHDVTEQLRREKLLRSSSEVLVEEAKRNDLTIRDLQLFRALVDQSNDAIEVLDPETLQFLDMNEKACTSLGYSREEMLRLTVLDIDSTRTSAAMDEIKKEMQQSGFLVSQSVHRRKDGSKFPVEVSMRWVHIDRDYVVSVTRDLSERKQAQEREREYERVVEGSSEIILVVDRQYRCVLANRAYLQHWGVNKDQAVGRLLPDLMGAHVFHTSVKKNLDECFEGKEIQFEQRYKFPNVGERDLFVSYFPIEGGAGVDRVACVMQDVTERKRVEQALRESEASERGKSKELETVLDTVPVAVYIARDAKCEYITTNRTGYEQLGLPHGSNISKKTRTTEELGFRILRNGVEIPSQELPMQRAAATARPEYEVPLSVLLKDGTTHEALFNAVPILGEDGKVTGVVGASIDITARKRAEDALRKRERTQKLILDHLSVGVILSSVEGERALYYNPKFVELFGYSIEECPTVAEWWALAYPDPAYRRAGLAGMASPDGTSGGEPGRD